MLIKTSIDEVHKRENAFKHIKKIINTQGRANLYDLTGLSGGFLATTQDLELLETYIGPAIFEEQLQTEGKKHLGGEKIFAVNRTSSGILATILALVPEKGKVQHFLKEKPGHPSIPRSCKLLNAEYTEHTDMNTFNIRENTNLIIITGSNMDHETLDEKTFEKIVSHAKNTGFVFQGSEIYGGLSNTWDFGPYGVMLKDHIKRAWQKKFIQEDPNNVEIQAAILKELKPDGLVNKEEAV